MKDGKLDLLVIFGGTSTEHEVSCKSAGLILTKIDREKYNVRTIGITKEGKWIETTADPDKIAKGSWIRKRGNREAYICPDRSVHGISTMGGKKIWVDCVIPVLHGKDGEDGTMQGLLEIAGLPYVGPKVLASACAMDKSVTKILVEKTGIRQAKYYLTDRYTFSSGPMEEMENIRRVFHGNYPLFVKPANAGSSVGISKVNSKEELFEGIKKAAMEDHKILIEEAIVGREMEIAVLGNRDPQASPIGEILSAAEFYDYDAKYDNPASRTEVVTDLSPTKACEMQAAALEIYKTLGCRGMSRVDFFLTENKEVVFNEVNTIPGFTEISM
ncbi:MAG: D-alanine--D-alanine ligase family protein, partial [Anaerovoracaceae bacterium]